MRIFTNSDEHGGDFRTIFENLIIRATSITIATGYTSRDLLDRYKDVFLRISSEGGNVTHLVGMALFEGLEQSVYDNLCEFDDLVMAANKESGGVKIVWNPTRFHGKIYIIEIDHEKHYFVGSSNFSPGGFENNLEFTHQVFNKDTIGEK